ncbi:MAG: type VI secretion system baseplate subunit TssK, partial [Brucella intermedia]
ISSAVNCYASTPLKIYIDEITSVLHHRAKSLSARIDSRNHLSFGDASDQFFLQVVNRNVPLFRHLQINAKRIHPIVCYELLIQLAGEMSTFTTDAGQQLELPPYKHDDLSHTFTALIVELRRSLSVIHERSVVNIELSERNHGLYVGVIHDRSLLTKADFILAVRCDLSSEDVRSLIPNRIRISSVERIAELINVALAGIAVRPIPVAPRQIPYQAGTVYFELNTTDTLWSELAASSSIALHLAGEYPGLSMELWALREQRS